MQKSLTIYCDGGSRGNPGPSAAGFVIKDGKKIVKASGSYLGIATNNQAEYTAVILALKAVNKYNPSKLTFYLDSELVVKQLNGEYKIKNQELKPLYNKIQEFRNKFLKISFRHVYRENNQLADAEVNRVLNAKFNGNI